MRNYSKRVRKLIREYAGLAYERELVAELGKLADRVNAWKQGEISPWELNDDIWKYVKGPQRGCGRNTRIKISWIYLWPEQSRMDF